MGNIQTAQTYTVSPNGSVQLTDEKTYWYENGIFCGYTSSNDGDVAYQTDEMGSPTEIGPETLAWGEGRMLTEITHGGEVSRYTYNSDGLRESKSVTRNGRTVQTQYVWGDNGLAAAITGKQTVVVLYDAESEAVGFSVDGTVYTYVKNLQGDVIRILDKDGTAVVSYTYDPWGVPTVSGDTGLAAINPCSYRGYYYDQETGYYYLQSRYYDPNIGRFLNADDTKLLKEFSKGLEYNLFSYCANTPINAIDPFGYWFINISVWTAGLVLDVIILLITVVAINVAKMSAIKWMRNISRAMKNLWNNLVRAVSTAIANSMNWIMQKFFSKYTHTTAARIRLSANQIANFINNYISYTVGYALASIIDRYDRDGRSGYIRF